MSGLYQFVCPTFGCCRCHHEGEIGVDLLEGHLHVSEGLALRQSWIVVQTSIQRAQMTNNSLLHR